MVIDWTHQIRDVLKRDSAQPLLEGLNPTPFVEIEFWKTKATNLECIYDQVRLSCFEYSDIGVSFVLSEIYYFDKST